MNYEQKYKEALERAEVIIRYYKERKRDEAAIEDLQEIFPELVESEGEKIRKAIKYCIKQGFTGYGNVENVTEDDCLAWLERQGEINTDNLGQLTLGSVATSIMNYIDEHALKGKMCLSNMECEQLDNAIRNADWMTVYKYMRKKFEKEDADTVEPRFKVGDWVVNNQTSNIYIVKEVKDDEYCLWPLDGIIQGYLRIIDVDTEYHLWTILDANEGDILTFKNHIGGIIICKSPTSYDTRSYCRLVNDCFIDKEESGWDSSLLIPASKEECDRLFSKMKEVGYTLDSKIN